MVWKKTTVLAAALALVMATAAAGYSDLPDTHWAYAEMSRAAELGIIRGVDQDRLAPGDALTWGQFLTMLSRSFAPEDYDAATAQGLAWDRAGYSAAMASGLLRLEDRDLVDEGTLGAAVKRQDAALLLARALPQEGTPSPGAAALSDFGALAPRFQTAVARLYGAGVVRGGGDGTFGGGDILRRADGSVLVLRVLEAGDPGPAVEAFAPQPVSTPTPVPAEVYVPLGQRDPRLIALDENSAKYLLLFGDTSKYRFATREEAQGGMAQITVPVWKLSGGVKTASTLSLEVHGAMAEDVKTIFTEIFDDPEQFPIWNVQGFRWQEGGKGEHNCGTAIDLNWEQNYQVRDGKVVAGMLWAPGVDPYSITPGGSVVRIFRAHGWSWGGDAWAPSSDASSGYHDYMHFSYLGG